VKVSHGEYLYYHALPIDVAIIKRHHCRYGRKFEFAPAEKVLYRMAINLSAAVQSKRWTEIEGGGFLYSFNGHILCS